MLQNIVNGFINSHIVFIITIIVMFLVSLWFSYLWGLCSAKNFSGPEGKMTGVKRNIYPYGAVSIALAMLAIQLAIVPGMSTGTGHRLTIIDLSGIAVLITLLAVGAPSLVAKYVCWRNLGISSNPNLDDS